GGGGGGGGLGGDRPGGGAPPAALDDSPRRPLGCGHARGRRAAAGRPYQGGRRAVNSTRHDSASQTGRRNVSRSRRVSSSISAPLARPERLQGSSLYIPQRG